MAADRSDRVIALLESIDLTLKSLLARSSAAPTQRRDSGVVDIADDKDLDGIHGNPELRFSPRGWTGPSYKGKRFSECPPELLVLVAESLDYFGRKAEEKGELTTSGKPIAGFKRLDSARARGWMQRLKNGWKPQAPPPMSAEWSDDAGSGDLEAEDIK